MRIPVGRVTTYGAIARYVGMQSSRVVGYALMAVPDDMGLPCHRVVNRNGELTGKHHFATPQTMQELLEAEGITVENDKIQNFDKLAWYPVNELL